MIARVSVSVILSIALTVDWNAGMERRPMCDDGPGCAPSRVSQHHGSALTGAGEFDNGHALYFSDARGVPLPARVPVLSIRSRSAALGLRAPVPSRLTESAPLTGSAGEDRVREARPHER